MKDRGPPGGHEPSRENAVVAAGGGDRNPVRLSLLSVALGSGTLVVTVLQVLPLAWRRVAPLPAALAVAVGCLVQPAVVTYDGPVPANLAVLVVLYSAAAHAAGALAALGLG